MKDIKHVTHALEFRNVSAGPWSHGEGADGVGKCGHYDVELDRHGYCRDEECRKKRLADALASGKAVKHGNTIIWCH